MLLPAAVIGGLTGGLLLLHTGEKLFGDIVPYLILLASLLLALGEPLKKWLNRGSRVNDGKNLLEYLAIPAVLLAAVYGGYFGAGLSVIFLAVLGVIFNNPLNQLNALKQALALATNIAAAIFFLFSGQVNWGVALVMAVCALLGGMAGGKLAGKISPVVLRWLVVGIGIVVAVIYFLK